MNHGAFTGGNRISRIMEMNVALRPASIDDVPILTEIRNYYIINTHITFGIVRLSVESSGPRVTHFTKLSSF